MTFCYLNILDNDIDDGCCGCYDVNTWYKILGCCNYNDVFKLWDVVKRMRIKSKL